MAVHAHHGAERVYKASLPQANSDMNITPMIDVLLVLLVIFMAALFSVQLVRGDIPPTDDSGEEQEMTWKQLFNGFLGVYQVFSSENWTHPLMNVLSSERRFDQAVIAGIFLGYANGKYPPAR